MADMKFKMTNVKIKMEVKFKMADIKFKKAYKNF